MNDNENRRQIRDLIILLIISAIIMLDLGSGDAHSEECSFKSDEYSLLKHAYWLAKPYDLHRTAVSILIAETYAGRYGPIGDKDHDIGKRSYGPAQIKYETACDIIERSDRINIEPAHPYELITDLIEKPYLNIFLMVEHLAWLRHDQDLTWRETVLAYNEGLSQVGKINTDTHPYVKKVVNLIDSRDVDCVISRISE